MNKTEVDKKFWQIAAGTAAEDTRMVMAVRLMLSKCGELKPSDVEEVAEAVAEVSDFYGLSANTDAANLALNMCENKLRDSL